MERYEILDTIENIGDVEAGFIVELANGVSSFINSIEGKINRIKKEHLSFIDNSQDSNLIGDISKNDFEEEGFNKNSKASIYKIPKSKTFYTANGFYIKYLESLIENKDFVEDSLIAIKRFRTKEKHRISMAGPAFDTLTVKDILTDMDKAKTKVFDAKLAGETAILLPYFGNIKTVHSNIDAMKELGKKINDKDLHKLNLDIERIGKELKKLITMLDSTTAIISKDAMNAILLRVNVLADYVTAISNLYYIHVESISSLESLKQKIK